MGIDLFLDCLTERKDKKRFFYCFSYALLSQVESIINHKPILVKEFLKRAGFENLRSRKENNFFTAETLRKRTDSQSSSQRSSA